jgi:hypothetical protein
MSAKRSAVLLAGVAAVLSSSLGHVPAATADPRISIGIRVDAPPPPLRREVIVVRPGPGFVWVPGHWDWAPYRHRYVWVAGAWVRPPFRHAVWVGPVWRHHRHRAYFLRGHWRRW